VLTGRRAGRGDLRGA